jgi:hypothetical protein
MDRHGRQEPLDERFATRSPFEGVRPVNSVSDLDDADGAS